MQEADDVFFAHSKRHVFARGVAGTLTCGAQFDGWRAQLDLPHLRIYSRTVQSVLGRFQ
jgi:hypothetical protein